MKTQEEIEQLAEQWLAETPIKEWGGVENGYIKGYSQCQKDIEYGAEEMYSRKYLVDFVYFLNDRHFNKYTVDTDEVDLFIEQFKKK
jgi:hypothetical protein